MLLRIQSSKSNICKLVQPQRRLLVRAAGLCITCRELVKVVEGATSFLRQLKRLDWRESETPMLVRKFSALSWLHRARQCSLELDDLVDLTRR